MPHNRQCNKRRRKLIDRFEIFITSIYTSGFIDDNLRLVPEVVIVGDSVAQFPEGCAGMAYTTLKPPPPINTVFTTNP